MSVVAGIDVGTTSVRVGLFDEGGERVAMVARRLSIAHPFPGAVEQDPGEIRDTCVGLLAESLGASGLDIADVSSLGIANQRSTVVAWDSRSGEPLRSALGWQDTRTAARVAELRAAGIPLNTSASCSKIEWLLANDTAVVEARRSGTLRIGTIDSWMTSCLTGGALFVTDPSNAGATGFYDASSGDWSDFVVEMFGADRSLLAAVVATDEVVGTSPVSLVGAEVPVAARAGDQQAACFAHAVGPGDAKLTLGTSAMLDVCTGTEIATAPVGTYSLPLWRLVDSHDPDWFCVEGSVNTAGAVIEWLVSMGLLDRVESLDEVVVRARRPVGFVPALAGSGSPDLDPDARGVITGVGLDTTVPDLVAGAVVGIAERIAAIADLLGVGDVIIVDGGLSRSTQMVQAIADLTARTVRRSVDVETTLRGAAALAARTQDGRDAVRRGLGRVDHLPRSRE